MKNKILILISLSLILSGCTSSENLELDNFANCLAEKGVKEYGAFWCPNCAKQEKIFGKSFSIIKEKIYIECDPRCNVKNIKDLPVACRGKISQTQTCLEKEINKYPTWDFPNGNRLVGVQELNILAKEVSCEFNGQK